MCHFGDFVCTKETAGAKRSTAEAEKVVPVGGFAIQRHLWTQLSLPFVLDSLRVQDGRATQLFLHRLLL